MSDQSFKSTSGISVRLTSERLTHILENHPEMVSFIFEIKSIITKPDFIIEGKQHERIALKKYKNYYLVIIYKEDTKKQDGFIVTAFKTTNAQYYLRKNVVWKKI